VIAALLVLVGLILLLNLAVLAVACRVKGGMERWFGILARGHARIDVQLARLLESDEHPAVTIQFPEIKSETVSGGNFRCALSPAPPWRAAMDARVRPKHVVMAGDYLECLPLTPRAKPPRATPKKKSAKLARVSRPQKRGKRK
jgi:hypothetical protein